MMGGKKNLDMNAPCYRTRLKESVRSGSTAVAQMAKFEPNNFFLSIEGHEKGK